MYFRKRKSKYNKNAGDVELASSIFNNSISSSDASTNASTTVSTIGEDINDYDRLTDKEKIFNEIKKLNPNANRKNYDKKSVRQMLAILNNYKDGKKRLTDKLHVVKYNPERDKKYNYSDIYFDDDSGDYMIRGLHLGFESEKEAEEYIKELNSNE